MYLILIQSVENDFHLLELETTTEELVKWSSSARVCHHPLRNLVKRNYNCYDKFENIHNSWLYCYTNPLELGTRVSLSHRQPYGKAEHVSQVQED